MPLHAPHIVGSLPVMRLGYTHAVHVNDVTPPNVCPVSTESSVLSKSKAPKPPGLLADTQSVAGSIFVSVAWFRPHKSRQVNDCPLIPGNANHHDTSPRLSGCSQLTGWLVIIPPELNISASKSNYPCRLESIYDLSDGVDISTGSITARIVQHMITTSRVKCRDCIMCYIQPVILRYDPTERSRYRPWREPIGYIACCRNHWLVR